MASLGALHKCQFSIDEYEVASELGVLERGITHFVANERFINYRQSQYDTLSNILKKKII
jgi:hypothetical protein